MKWHLILCFLLYTNTIFAQKKEWTKEQVAAADVNRNEARLTDEEKNVFLYMNLARLFPEDYIAIELFEEQKSKKLNTFERSLIQTMKKMKPLGVITFDDSMYELAKCFAAEQGPTGKVGHDRKKCTDGYRAECCDYGFQEGREIVKRLLVDFQVTSLGHRKIVLSPSYSKAGVSIGNHSKHKYLAVLDFN
jgi:uncharacterized protein YkwD